MTQQSDEEQMRRQGASELDWWVGIRCAGWLHISRWLERQCHTHKNNRENRDQKNTQEGERHTRNRGVNGEIKQWPWHSEKYSYTILHILCYFGSGSFTRKEVSGRKDTLYFAVCTPANPWETGQEDTEEIYSQHSKGGGFIAISLMKGLMILFGRFCFYWGSSSCRSGTFISLWSATCGFLEFIKREEIIYRCH